MAAKWPRSKSRSFCAEASIWQPWQSRAEVCLDCGERLYSKQTVSRFEQIRKKLANHQVEEFDPLGQSFQIPV